MNHNTHPQEAFFAADLDPEELQKILERIDENLAFRQALRNEGLTQQAAALPIPDLPSLDQLTILSNWLKMSSAPLHSTKGLGGPRGLILRLLNLPVRIFGGAQIEYNRKQREYIGEVTTIIYGLNAQTTAIRSVLEDLQRKVQAAESSSLSSQEQFHSFVEQMGDLKNNLDQAAQATAESD